VEEPLSKPFPEPEAHRTKLSPLRELGAETLLSWVTFLSTRRPANTTGEFPVSCRPHRSDSSASLAPTPLFHPSPALQIGSPLIKSQPSHSRSMITIRWGGYPFGCLNPWRTSEGRRLRIVSWSVVHGPAIVDSDHETVDLFHGFFNRKIIQFFQKLVGTWYFYKNTVEHFQNYILVPIIFHLGPYLTFYNYN
jgi:hypothetical protein